MMTPQTMSAIFNPYFVRCRVKKSRSTGGGERPTNLWLKMRRLKIRRLFVALSPLMTSRPSVIVVTTTGGDIGDIGDIEASRERARSGVA
jgi:hypothetical protein